MRRVIETKLNILTSHFAQKDIKKKIRQIKNFSFKNKKYEISK